MISYRKSDQNDLDEIMDVISDIEISQQDESKKIINERVTQNQLLCVFLYNKIIGFIGWNTKFQNNPEFWYLEQITIQKNYRGKGIGQNFVKYFLQFCRDKKVKKIFAHIQEHNKKSLKMFLNTGWIINTESDKNKLHEITIEFYLK
ncbi:MAG: GNAT family N-acetyltransferase [bacterium]|nr:GNAT family N-acetyltransferase [bacterium]